MTNFDKQLIDILKQLSYTFSKDKMDKVEQLSFITYTEDSNGPYPLPVIKFFKE